VTTTARVRVARMEDYAALGHLMRRASLALPDYREHLLAHPDSIHFSADHISAGRTLVAEGDGIVTGFIAWLPIGDATAELEALFVEPSHWRLGVGKELLAAASEAVTGAGFKNLYVVAPPAALDFYRRCGFVRTGATATQFGPALTMLKEIGSL
jgi:GNAT superfamily N-acetyltransferase